ncbi:MAG: sigma-54 dependent transcriptional regulator [Minicystis sp.]
MIEARILIIDDDQDTRETLKMVLDEDGYLCDLAPSATVGLEKLGEERYDVVLCDVCMAGMDGFELLDRVRARQPTIPVIMVTGSGKIHDAVDAIKRGAFHYLIKPYDLADLRLTIREAIGDRRRLGGLGPRLATTRPEPAVELVGDGPAMRRLRDSITLVAASSAPVLVVGEIGTGKSLVARAILESSPRHAGPFVSVNLTAIPDEHIEGEIFGHVPGRSKGGEPAHRGSLTEATEGTLLLREIGDMPLDLQAKLLRVLQSGEVHPIGSDRAHSVNVRVIATTHCDLVALVREKRFREDLYYRLNVLPVSVPALRDRREDIPALAAHFLTRARERSPASPVRSISPMALALLAEAPWPGNVRELASIVERLVVFGREEVVAPSQLTFLQQADPSHARPQTLRRVTEAYTEQVLAQTGGNKQRAAEILDVDPSTLYRWQRSRKG